MAKTYFIDTGKKDQLRLEILNKIYNPVTINFLTTSGLKPGMTVLEVGCGTGLMSCAMAQIVGKNGRVVATDNSEEQLKLAHELARQRGYNNIDFLPYDGTSPELLNIPFDFAYGRW